MNKGAILSVFAALAVGLVLFVLWEVFAPGEPPPVQLPGCAFVSLHETYKRDAGVGYRDYDLICVVKGSAPAPSCDEVMGQYIHAKGRLPKDVNVIVRREDPRSPEVCRSHYRGDGRPWVDRPDGTTGGADAMQMHIEIRLQEGDSVTEMLRTRHEIEDWIAAEGVGTVVDTGGGRGVMDIYFDALVTDAQARVEQMLASRGLLGRSSVRRVD